MTEAESFPRERAHETQGEKPRKIAVLMASFERPKLTLRALHTLRGAAETAGADIGVFLTDASNDDETYSLVSAQFPEVRVSRVPSTSFWADSMRVSWELASESNFEFLLWLNDDVQLHRDSISMLLSTSSYFGDAAIIVGATQDPITGKTTYGGYLRGGVFRRLSLTRVFPAPYAQRVQLANGNVLLVPSRIDQSLGGFPRGFGHSMADLFYTGKANRKKTPILLAPGFSGTCEANSSTGTWLDSKLDLASRWSRLNSPKGVPLGTWNRLCFALGGISAPAYLLRPMVSLIFSHLRSRRVSFFCRYGRG